MARIQTPSPDGLSRAIMDAGLHKKVEEKRTAASTSSEAPRQEVSPFSNIKTDQVRHSVMSLRIDTGLGQTMDMNYLILIYMIFIYMETAIKIKSVHVVSIFWIFAALFRIHRFTCTLKNY